jgi:hypothetical protein
MTDEKKVVMLQREEADAIADLLRSFWPFIVANVMSQNPGYIDGMATGYSVALDLLTKGSTK